MALLDMTAEEGKTKTGNEMRERDADMQQSATGWIWTLGLCAVDTATVPPTEPQISCTGRKK